MVQNTFEKPLVNPLEGLRDIFLDARLEIILEKIMKNIDLIRDVDQFEIDSYSDSKEVVMPMEFQNM